VVIFPYQATADLQKSRRRKVFPLNKEKERDKAEEDQTDEKISRMDRIIL